MKHIPRFFFDGKIQSGGLIKLPDVNTHHLLHVLRAKHGDTVKLFNKDYGEWTCSCEISKKNVFVKVENKIRDYSKNLDSTINLCFPIISQQRLSIIFEKCTELGVTNFIPIISDFSQNNKIDKEKANRIFISAAEQSGRLDIPQISDPIKLENLLNRSLDLLLVFDVTGENINTIDIFSDKTHEEIYLLVGPEGGFSEKEIELFKKSSSKNVKIVKCGNNIMRSETACIMASCLCLTIPKKT